MIFFNLNKCYYFKYNKLFKIRLNVDNFFEQNLINKLRVKKF